MVACKAGWSSKRKDKDGEMFFPFQPLASLKRERLPSFLYIFRSSLFIFFFNLALG